MASGRQCGRVCCVRPLFARQVTRPAASRRTAGSPLQELYEEHAPIVFRHVSRAPPRRHEAQDVTQAVFLKLIDALPLCDARRGDVLRWVLRIAHNWAIDELRRRPPLLAAEVPDATRYDDGDAQRVVALQTALAGLPHDQRDVVVLRHVVGLRTREIASCTARTQSAVQALEHRARVALRARPLRLGAGPSTSRRSARVPPACGAFSSGMPAVGR
jgi:RNA polymerase sigma-70 factor, ECF subfamily